MKEFFLVDELNHLHLDILKSILLILVLLPICDGLFNIYHFIEDSSQIVIGFFAFTLLSAWLILCFLSALKTSMLCLHKKYSKYENYLFKIYRTVPMLFLIALLTYCTVIYSI